MKNKRQQVFRMGEFFCGPGGLSLGAKLAKVASGSKQFSIRHAWATDYDYDSCETYRMNICPESPDTVMCEDIQNLDFNVLKKMPSIDGFAFGFPCNDFSIVGKQKGINGVYGPLYAHGVRAIRLFEPKFFLAENVGGIRNANDGNIFRQILRELFDAGYSLYPHLYSFNQYRVPQVRQRVIIIGIRRDLDVVFTIPSPKPFEKIDVSCRTALEQPPIKDGISNNELTRQSKTVVERLSYIKPGENAFTADIPNYLQLNVRDAKISQIYKRLDPNKPAYTVTGSGGGGTHMYHWKENRALTNRERARLQTFPDNFIFSGSKESVRKQIGMAVPCVGAKIIFEAVIRSFAGIRYPSVTANIEPMLHSSHVGRYNDIVLGQSRICEKRRVNLTRN